MDQQPDPLRREHAIDAMTTAVHALNDDPNRVNADRVYQAWQDLLAVIGAPSWPPSI